MSGVEWADAERGCCFGTCGGDVSQHAPHQDQGCWMFESMLNYLAPHIAARLAQAWGEGHDAGHRDARAVNPEWPQLTRNPYRSEP